MLPSWTQTAVFACLVAVAKSWIEDAQGNHAELALVADWLEVSDGGAASLSGQAADCAAGRRRHGRSGSAVSAVLRFSLRAMRRQHTSGGFVRTPCLRRATNERRRQARP